MNALFTQLSITEYVPELVLQASLKSLTPREECVIRLTYNTGLSDTDLRKELRIRTGRTVSQARLLQIRAKALRKLMHRSRLGQYVQTKTTA